MADKYFSSKKQPMPLLLQKMKIEKMYSNLEPCSVEKRSYLQCILNIKPSEHSQQYKVKVLHKPGERPKALLLSPQLQEYEGEKPPHIYRGDGFDHPSLCVYTPGEFDFRSGTVYLADKFIPCISTWLNAYEYWLITGEWHYPGRIHAEDKQCNYTETGEIDFDSESEE